MRDKSKYIPYLIDGTVYVPPEVPANQLVDEFLEFCEAKGYLYSGFVVEEDITQTEDEEDNRDLAL